MEWQKLPVSLSELCLASVLRCGQSFRWKSSESGEWSCALRGRILTVRQDATHLYYHAVFPLSSVIKKSDALNDTTELVRDYFNLSIDLTDLYEKWSSRDPHFKKTAFKFAGIRMLRQDPWENLVSFICSSNNNIIRISQMVENLCINFGLKIGQLNNITYYDFPVPTTLTSAGVEEKLRALGFGYRAKYIHRTARMIVDDHPVGWLDGLRKVEYRDAHEALLQLQGVGPKVADCVCLMSLDKTEAVPVDTHVWQIAMRDYKFGKGRHKSLTKATYTAIGDRFRELWGNEAGWAHSVLFTADLKAFAEREVKVEESVTSGITTSSTIVKEEEEEEGPRAELGGECGGDIKQEVKIITTTTLVGRGRRPKAEPRDENKHEIKVEGRVGTVSVKVVKREKRVGKAKTMDNKKSDDGADPEVEVKPITTVRKGRITGTGIQTKGEGRENLGSQVKEDVFEGTLEGAKRSLKRSVKTEDEEMDMKLDEIGMTMADRIKRRRR